MCSDLTRGPYASSVGIDNCRSINEFRPHIFTDPGEWGQASLEKADYSGPENFLGLSFKELTHINSEYLGQAGQCFKTKDMLSAFQALIPTQISINPLRSIGLGPAIFLTKSFNI